MIDPQLEYAFEIRVDIDPHLRIGRSADEELSFTPISGGTVAGPLLNGVVLAGGGDWAVERWRWRSSRSKAGSRSADADHGGHASCAG